MACGFPQEGIEDLPSFRVSALDRQNAFPNGSLNHRKGGVKALRDWFEQIKTLGKANSMALYEHTFLARQDISSQQAEALADQYKAVLEENGGSVSKTENWGLRTAAYRIQKNRKCHYIHMNVDAPASALAEMERQMRINEDILRFMTIRVEEHEEGQSAMMKKSDRDDRPRRNDRDDRPRRDAADTAPESEGE